MTGQVNDSTKAKTGLRAIGLLGAFASVMFMTGVLAWAHYTEINGAVIAQGKAVAIGKPKTVQHLDGGIVNEILVEDGTDVVAGAVIMRLDDTQLRANIEIYRGRLANGVALRDRLEAEQLGAGNLKFDDDVSSLTRGYQDDARAGQLAIFMTRRDVHLGRLKQLDEKIVQFSNQLAGINALIDSKKEQLKLMDSELDGLQTLLEKGLIPRTRILALQRSRAEMLGQLGEHDAQLARVSNSVRDTELEILLVKGESQEKAVTELRDTRTSIDELKQQILATEEQLARVDIRAPVNGLVHELQYVTVGGVVAPGGVVAQIIPTGKGVVFETRVDPTSIDQVYIGQSTRLRLSAFNHRTTPEIGGNVINRSADAVLDETTGASFYRVLINAPVDELAKLGELKIVPGMPVEAFLQTGNRRVLSYLVAPVTDQLKRAFLEE